ncbi:MAG: sugar phosphate isomerase/epimerase family protein [Gillisia sp.]
MKYSPAKTLSRLLPLLIFSILVCSCKDAEKNKKQEIASTTTQSSESDLFFKLSLAEWSFHTPLQNGEMNPMDFAKRAKELGFSGLEYVSQFYTPLFQNSEDPKAALQKILDTLKAKSEKYNVKNVLIMVDNEGDLASPEESERNQAVDNHKKWVDAAQFLGCHAIRVNLFGSDSASVWKPASIDGLTKLAKYAADKKIEVLVENHGYLSSNSELLAKVIQGVGMPNCGTLPDFGNFCLRREGGERWNAPCIKEYPRYKGIEEMMPYAKAVSAKSYDFDKTGNETLIDYYRVLKIVKDAGYTGFIGTEYEGTRLSPVEGIKATKNLLIKAGKKVQENH